MDIEQRYTSALRDLDTGRYKSIRAAVAVYKLDHSTLGRRRRGQRTRVESYLE